MRASCQALGTPTTGEVTNHKDFDPVVGSEGGAALGSAELILEVLLLIDAPLDREWTRAVRPH
jgi:hypothetical protein